MADWKLDGRRIVAGAVCVAAVAALAACGSDGEDANGTAQEERTLLIGMPWEMSGEYSPYGQPAVDGAELAISEVNASGGVQIGNTGYKFRLKVVDDRSEVQTAIAATTQLIRDEGAKFILGPLGPNAPPVMAFAAKNDVLHFNSGAVAGTLAGTKDYPLLFSSVLAPSRPSVAAIAVAALKRFVTPMRSVALVGPDDQQTNAFIPLVAEALEAEGVNPSTYTFPAESTDLSVVMAKVADSDPDAVFICCNTSILELAAASFDSGGISPSTPIFASGVSAGFADVVEGHPFIAAPYVESDFTVENPTPEAEEFGARLEKSLDGRKMTANAVVAEYFYSSIKLLALAMEEAQTVTDTAAIAGALPGLEVTGTAGKPVHYDDKHQIVQGADFTYLDGKKSITAHFGG